MDGLSPVVLDETGLERLLHVVVVREPHTVAGIAFGLVDLNPPFEEILASVRDLSVAYSVVERTLANCHQLTVFVGGTKLTATVGATSFPSVADQSTTYQLDFVINGVNVPADLIVFRQGSVLGELLYGQLGAIDTSQFQLFVNTAMANFPAARVAGVPNGAIDTASLQRMLVNGDDVPNGWSAHVSDSSSSTSGGPTCSTTSFVEHPYAQASVAYVAGPGFPAFTETLAWSSGPRSTFATMLHVLENCPKLSWTDDGATLYLAASAVDFPRVGDQSAAYQMSFTGGGVPVWIDYVVARRGPVQASFVYAAIDSIDVDQLRALIDKALAKVPDR